MVDDRWTWNFDVYDESYSPTKEGYYRTIDDEGNEITDYYFNEPIMTPHGIGYWKYGTRPIIAWKYLGEGVADTPQTDCDKCIWNVCNYNKVDWDADTPQTEKSNNEYYLELADAVMRGEMSDAEANQAWYEHINKQDTPQTDCDDRYAVRTDSGEVVAYACPLGCEQTDCGWK